MYNNQVRFILLGIFFSLAIGDASFVGFKADNEMCPPINVTCICGTESNAGNRSVSMIINRYLIKSLSTGRERCHPLRHPSKICKRISCELGPIEPEHIGGPVNVSSSYPIEISIPSKGGDHNDSDDRHNGRSARDVKMCHIKRLNHADIKCWRWPKFVDCLINCTFGHALSSEEGSVLSKGMSCTYDENRWWPHGFQDCEPYINCKAHLVSAGTLKCSEPLHEPAYCDIACLDYESKEGTKPKKYVCKDENFESTLPHCARLNKNEPILETPNKQKPDKPKPDYEIEFEEK